MEGDRETGEEFEEGDGDESDRNMRSGMWPALSGILDDTSSHTRPMEIRHNMPRYM